MIVAILREVVVTEENIVRSIIEHNDELVRVRALNVRLKPTDVINTPRLLNTLHIVILDYHSIVLQLWVVTDNSACLGAKQQLKLGLVLALNPVLVGPIKHTGFHVSHLTFLLQVVRDSMLVQERSEVNARHVHL